MAEFLPAYEKMILSEGGYKLHKVKGDTGGLTYAGIARNKNPQWPGWAFIDRGEIPPSILVRIFYREGWWEPLRGDDIAYQDVAESIFNFAMNTSGPGRPLVAAKLVQVVVGTTPDGVIGPLTVAAINAMESQLFLALYSLAKLTRYRDIVSRNRSQEKFLLGWLNRTLQRSGI